MDPRRLLPFLLVVAVLAVATTTAVLTGRGGAAADQVGAASPHHRAAVPPDPDGPRAVLAAWDARRARAWAMGDTARLRSLYAPGSRAGRADVELLEAYVGRGLTVEGMQTQVLAFTVADHTSSRLEVEVADRVVGAVAVGPDGSVRLPTASPVRRSITLLRVRGKWLVDEVRVRRDPPPAPG